jgi:hypothetical protein
MKRFVVSLLLTLFLTFPSLADTNIAEYLQSICVLIDTPSGSGSGIVFHRKDSNGKDITLIWTANHVTSEDIELFDIALGPTTISSNYPSVNVFQPILKDGAIIGTNKTKAYLLKTSDKFKGMDLSILQINGVFYNTNSAIFDLSGKIPRVSDRLISASCPIVWASTYSEGYYSFLGRIVGEHKQFRDQTSLIVYKGSSGGGAYTSDGKCVGVLVEMAAPNINFMVPIRKIQEWVKKEHVEWAIDPNIPFPTDKELRKLPLIDGNP